MVCQAHHMFEESPLWKLYDWEVEDTRCWHTNPKSFAGFFIIMCLSSMSIILSLLMVSLLCIYISKIWFGYDVLFVVYFSKPHVSLWFVCVYIYIFLFQTSKCLLCFLYNMRTGHHEKYWLIIASFFFLFLFLTLIIGCLNAKCSDC